jgi:hypothetical protein
MLVLSVDCIHQSALPTNWKGREEDAIRQRCYLNRLCFISHRQEVRGEQPRRRKLVSPGFSHTQLILRLFEHLKRKIHIYIKLKKNTVPTSQKTLWIFITNINRLRKVISSRAESRDSAVVNSDCLQDGRSRGWSSSPGMVKNFLFSTSFTPALGLTEPPIQRVPEDLSSGVKRPGRKAHHSPPTSAEVKKTWIYRSTPPYVFMA